MDYIWSYYSLCRTLLYLGTKIWAFGALIHCEYGNLWGTALQPVVYLRKKYFASKPWYSFLLVFRQSPEKLIDHLLQS